jgi:plasmid stabilization system protein ParE
MRRLRFTVAARKDFSDIARQSQVRWGPDQRTKYVEAIRRRLNQLCERPELGPAFGPDRPGLHRLNVGSHLIFYRFDDARLRVIRILDQRMDLAARLGETDEP